MSLASRVLGQAARWAGRIPVGLADLTAGRLRFDGAPAERYSAATADGWQLALHRVRTEPRPPGGPVMLLHGLAANRHAFHFPGRSLAEWLAAHGYDCWIAELRGRGDSWHPAARRRADWDLEDYVCQDVPALIDTIRRHADGQPVHWIGHSMGGLLLYCHGIRFGSAGLARGVAIASALDYRVGPNDFQTLVKLRGLMDYFDRVPYGLLTDLCAPLMGRAWRGLESFSYVPGNVEPELARRYFVNVCNDIAPGVLASLATALAADGLASRDRQLSYRDEAHRFTIPLLALAGVRDRQVHPSAIRRTVERFGSGDKRVRVMGREHGDPVDYGHFDLILGREAQRDVWPEILDWLRADPTGD